MNLQPFPDLVQSKYPNETFKVPEHSVASSALLDEFRLHFALRGLVCGRGRGAAHRWDASFLVFFDLVDCVTVLFIFFFPQ